MRFSCPKSTLGEAVSVCAHAVSAKSSTQILEGLLIEAAEQVTMAGYNYRLGIKRTFEAAVEQPGSVVIHARLLSDIIRKMPDETIEITCDDHLMVTIQCGSSRFNLVGSPAAEYPELPEIARGGGVSVPGDALRELILGTVFAVSDNENKPIHTGSLFEVTPSSLTVISVDGYRLAVRRQELENEGAEFKFVVPGDALREISRILPDGDAPVTIYPDRKQALFAFEGTLVITRLLEGEFLNWRAAVPDDHPVRLTMSRSALIAAVERVSLIIVSDRLKNPIHCVFDGQTLELQCTTAVGRSYDACAIPHCPEKIEIGFNNRYLLDALRACPDEEIVVELKSGLSPCILRPAEGEDFMYMVLPVRLKAGE